MTYTVGQPHDAAGRQRRPKYDRSRQWAACPIGSRNPTTCGRLSASSTRRPRRSVSREDNLLLFDAGRDRVSRRAASRNSSYQRETQGRPRRFASAPPRAHTGHPILATCEARERAPRVPIGQASVSGRIRRGRLRAGARLPRAGGEPWLNFIVYSFAKCCPQSILAVGLSHRGTAPRGCPRGTFGDVLHL